VIDVIDAADAADVGAVPVARETGGMSDAVPGTLVALEGAMNLRDVGGYPVGDDLAVVRGQVFRSDHLATLTDADHIVLCAIGIATVLDLRHDAEVDQQPSRLWSTVLHHERLPMADEMAQQGSFVERVLNGHFQALTDESVVDLYLDLLERHAAVFGTVLTRIADPNRRPVLFHCTAGKDRTGLAAALLHEVLGVDREDVLDDYELSRRYRTDRRVAELRPMFEERGVDIESVMPILSAPRAALAGALHRLDEHGGAEAYLTGAAGMHPDTIAALREQLLTPR
jgi:protein-tyrosine phosphatase